MWIKNIWLVSKRKTSRKTKCGCFKKYFGNDIYLDNIKFYTKFYPQGIQQKGYAIYPNPTVSVLNIQHLNMPIALKSIQLINSIGRKVMQINYAGNTQKEILINTSRLATDVYVLQLIYTDKTITEKIVKMK